MSLQFDNLQNLKYSELRKIAKNLGIKSKAKTDILKDINQVSKASIENAIPTTPGTPQPSTPAVRTRSTKKSQAPSSVKQSLWRQQSSPNTEVEEEEASPPKKRKENQGFLTPVLPRRSARLSGLGPTPIASITRSGQRRRTPAVRVLSPNPSPTPGRSARRKTRRAQPTLKSAKRVPKVDFTPITEIAQETKSPVLESPVVRRNQRKSSPGSTPIPPRTSSRRTSRRQTQILSPILIPPSEGDQLSLTPRHSSPASSPVPAAAVAKKSTWQKSLSPIAEISFNKDSVDQTKKSPSTNTSTPKKSTAASEPSPLTVAENPPSTTRLRRLTETLSPIPAVVVNSTVTLSAEEKENKEKQAHCYSPRYKRAIPRVIPTPNFAKIHQRNFEKMESLVDYVNRKKMKTRIPKLAASTEVKFVPSVLKTSKINTNFTGRTTKKATKAPAYKFEGGANTSGLNSSLLNSSFHKRKAFDLHASLDRKPKYQPHRGKLKPLNKTHVQVEKKREEGREVLRGVRINRRFDLLMKGRQN